MLQLVVAACSDGVGRNVESLTGPPAVTSTRRDSFPVRVTLSSGVTGSPAAGTLWIRAGDSLQYHYRAAEGFQLAAVRVDGGERPTRGTWVVRDSVRLTAVALPDTSIRLRTARDAQMERLLAAANPVPALLQWEADFATVDSIQRADMERARFAAILRLGPDGWSAFDERVARSQDDGAITLGATPAADDVLASTANALRSSAAVSSGGAARVTVIYVNGVLTTASAAREARSALGKVVIGRTSAGATLTPRTIFIPAYLNPIARIDASNPARCLRELQFLSAAINSGPGLASAFSARLSELLSQRQHTECFSTNLRVITDYIIQAVGGTSSLNQTDQRLRTMIEREREQGTNVLVVGHSQGTVISRNVLTQLKADARGLGCVAYIAAGSPIPASAPIGPAQFVRAVIARGEENGVRDILWPLWPGRTDGQPSPLTVQLDSSWRSSWLSATGVLPGIGETVATLTQLGTQLRLHGFVETYANPSGYATVIGRWADEAVAGLEKRCAYTDVEVDAPTLIRAEEAVPDVAVLRFTNRSTYASTIRLRPFVTDAPAGRIDFSAERLEFELAAGARDVRVAVPFTPKPGIAPGDYNLQFDVEAVPAVPDAAAPAQRVSPTSRLRVSAPPAHWVVLSSSVDVTVRATAGDPLPGTTLSLELNGGQRRTFSPSSAGTTFTLTLEPGRNGLDLYTEQLPRGQLLVGLEITVRGAHSGDSRRVTAGPLTTRSSANPISFSVRRQFEARL